METWPPCVLRSVTALRCGGSRTHRSLSHLFLSHLFLFLPSALPSPSSISLCSHFVAPLCLSVNVLSYFQSFHFLFFTLFSISLSTLLSSRPFLPKGSHWLLSHGESRNGRIRSIKLREIHPSLSQWPAFCGSNAFSCIAASGVWKSAAAVWGSHYLWGVLHPDVYAACHHK